MSYREQLLHSLNLDRIVLKNMLGDIGEENSLRRISDGGSHIKWIVGHILYGADRVYAYLQEEEPDRKIEKKFGYQTAASDNPAEYPPLSELYDRINKIHDKLADYVSSLSDEGLEKEIKAGERPLKIWQMLTGYIMHEYYHIGQIAMIRTALGLKRPFE
jgi:uncharacterized damage-inducible protein DinB